MTQTTKNINNRPSRRRRSGSSARVVIVLFVLLILIAASVLAFLNRDKISSIFSPRTETQTPSEEERKEENDNKSSDAKEKESEKDETPVREAEKASNAQYEGEDPNSLESITGAISFADISEGNFRVNVVVDQALGTSGNCKFTLVHSSGVTITGSSSTEAGPSSSVCVYVVSASSIQPGNWKITANITAGSKTGTITREVNI